MVVLMMLGADKFRKTIKDLIEKIFAWINKNSKNIATFIQRSSVYTHRYIGKKLQPLINQSTAIAKYGKAGGMVVKAVDDEVANMIKNLSKKKRDKNVMISGMVYNKEGIVSKVHTQTNFISDEIGKLSEKTGRYLDELGNDSIYQKFLNNMHPYIKESL